MFLRHLGFDLKSAWYGVRSGGLASLMAVAALAVGIGATALATTVAYSGLVRPLAFPDDSRLITLERVWGPTGLVSGIKLDEFSAWRDGLAGAARLAAFTGERVTVRDGGMAQDARAAYVVGNWFQMLGAQPLAGRLMDDSAPADEAVVSQAFASRRSREQSGGDPWTHLHHWRASGHRRRRAAAVVQRRRRGRHLGAGARRQRAGRHRERRRENLSDGREGRARSLDRHRPRGGPDDAAVAGARLAASKLADARAALARSSAWRREARAARFLVGSMLVLLAACANVAMLLVNRAIARAREFAVRVALGASRGRLLTVATLETAMLGLAGTVGGWWMARAASAFLQSRTELGLPFLATRASHGAITIGAVCAGACLIAISAAAPLIAYRRVAIAAPLRSATSTGSRAGRRLRAGLVVAQLAMTVVLLTGAGLLGRTLLVVSRADLGLTSPERVISMNVPVGESLAPGARVALVQRLIDDIRHLPGVLAAGVGGALPPVQPGLVFTIRVTNSDGTVDATRAFDLVPVTDGYFEALGAQVLEGRTLAAADGLSTDAVCVLSESAAKHLRLAVTTAVGRQISLSLPTASGVRVKPVVVGVIRDIRYSGLDAPAHGGIYVPWRQLPLGSAYLVARAAGDPAFLAPSVTQLVRDADPSIPIRPPVTLDAAVASAAAPRALRFSLAGVFGLGAALLAVVGLSGALIRSVVERQRELAVRAAVGATPRQLLRDVMGQGMLLSGLGVGAGLTIAAALGQGISSILYGVPARDPVTYAGASATVLAIAMAACYWPARRAAAADPVTLFRSE